MSPSSGTASRVLDGLLAANLLSAEQVEGIRAAAALRGVHIGVILAERDLVSPLDVVSIMEHEMGVPQVDLSSYAPEDEALAFVPAAIALKHRILPLFEIEGILTAAIGDPMDVFVLDAVGQEIGLEVEPVLADAVSFAAALYQYYPADLPVAEPAVVPQVPAEAEAAPVDEYAEAVEETPAVLTAPEVDVSAPAVEVPSVAQSIEEMAPVVSSGHPAIDLDVLAVADARTAAVLVADILEDAVSRGASRIHLLPYKDDFFLVYRIKGALEKIASAPLSLEAALVDGFKQFVKLGAAPASRPALGRVRSKIGDRELVLTLSVVPTVAGQRLVVSLAAPKSQPRTLEELGVLDAETRALKAMVERGRGILLVCAPLASGASSTYYALLAHAASIGKTVYSVENTVEYEIPAAAQVMVDPGGPSAAVYIAAGLRQDVDVVAVDGLRSVDDVHMAVEAAAQGKLVIATFAAADIAAGVRRMLDLGVEPLSLASALTLGVGQRLVRLNCPSCSVETDGVLAARIPGAAAGLKGKAGSGCPNCGNAGYRGSIALHEVLPFTDPVRAAVGRASSREDIARAALAAGMRPLLVAGLARVKSGEVSADELNRVVRFVD